MIKRDTRDLLYHHLNVTSNFILFYLNEQQYNTFMQNIKKHVKVEIQAQIRITFINSATNKANNNNPNK